MLHGCSLVMRGSAAHCTVRRRESVYCATNDVAISTPALLSLVTRRSSIHRHLRFSVVGHATITTRGHARFGPARQRRATFDFVRQVMLHSVILQISALRFNAHCCPAISCMVQQVMLQMACSSSARFSASRRALASCVARYAACSNNSPQPVFTDWGRRFRLQKETPAAA